MPAETNQSLADVLGAMRTYLQYIHQMKTVDHIAYSFYVYRLEGEFAEAK